MTRAKDLALGMKVLIVDDEIDTPTAEGRAVRSLVDELEKGDAEVIKSCSADDGKSVILSDPSIQCILMDWTLCDDDPNHDKARELLKLIRTRNSLMPVFLMSDSGKAPLINAEVMSLVDELVWVLEDTPTFIAGRALAAMNRYREQIEPPFTKALMDFAKVSEYSWHTPGHTGGTAFLKSPAGRAFFHYFGENLLRSDLSISVGELGSLLDHSGPIGESEKYASQIFGADRSYTVTNGTSASNRIVFMASVTRGDHVLVDRNCHKSIEQALIMTGAIPAYMKTSRNHLGLIGPIYPENIGKDAVMQSILAHKLVVAPENDEKEALSGEPDKQDLKDNQNMQGTQATQGTQGTQDAQNAVGLRHKRPVHAIITNSTYDGLCYNVRRVLEILGDSVDRIHFDEAWYGYARFNPLYRERYGMFEKSRPDSSPTVFTTTSTHKLLAALSQASFIHVRDGKNKIPHDRFNESFMMHSSTSPQYAIIASNEVSAAMMSGESGQALTRESIDEAIAFRQSMRKICKEAQENGEWFFDVWNADKIRGVDFERVSPKTLAEDPECWVLHSKDKWHGFSNLEEGYCMLDPIKVSVVTPGIERDGSLREEGEVRIPAMLVTSYLDNRGIVVEKTTDFTILFLFSMGITKGKWGTLVNALLRFRDDYNKNTPLKEVLPDKVLLDPDHYQKMGLKDLAEEMIKKVKELNLMGLQKDIYATNLPKQDKTPNQAYQKFVHGQAELLPLKEIAQRTIATGIIPYPPGIPMLLSGENIGPASGPHLKYLCALQRWDKHFAGFGHDIHGVENKDRKYYIHCLKKA